MALIDEIKKRLTTQPEAAPAVSQQAQAIAAFQAKTGKAAGGGAPRASNVGEQMANAQVDAAQRQLTAKGAQAAAGLGVAQAQQAAGAAVAQQRLVTERTDAAAGLAASRADASATRAAAATDFTSRLRAQESQTTDQINAKAQQTIDRLTSDRSIGEADIFSEFKAANNELAYRRDYIRLEQLAHTLALRDREYVDTLIRTGQERRLDSDLGFRAEMQDMILGEGLGERLKQLNFQLELDAEDNAFNEQLDRMNVDQALAIAMAQNKDASLSAMMTNLGTAGQGIADNWPESDNKSTGAQGPGYDNSDYSNDETYADTY